VLSYTGDQLIHSKQLGVIGLMETISVIRDVNKESRIKEKDKDKDLTFKDKDKDQRLQLKDRKQGLST